MSVNVPLHKWRSADPVILIGRRCIARTDQDVVIDGRLELIRHPDGTASLRFQGIGNDIISHDPNTCFNSMSDGIRSLAIYRNTSAIRQIWACSCERHGILILTRHDDLKEAIRAWNTEATRQERKHSK